MKSVIGGLMLLASVNSTAAVAQDSMVTMVCLSENKETFTIFVHDNDAAIKWPEGMYPAQITVEGNKVYLKQDGSGGTMGIVYDMELQVGLAVTKFNDGHVVSNAIRCSIN